MMHPFDGTSEQQERNGSNGSTRRRAAHGSPLMFPIKALGAGPARVRSALPRQKKRQAALLWGGFALLVFGVATMSVRSRSRPNAAPISVTSGHKIAEAGDPSGMRHSGHAVRSRSGAKTTTGGGGDRSDMAKELMHVDGLVVLGKPLEPGEGIKVSGTGGPATLNLWNDDRSEVLFQFNPRGGKHVIVRGVNNENTWQEEERGGGYPFTQTDGTWDFELIVENSTTIGMFVEGKKFGTFDLRQHKISDITKLTIGTKHPNQDNPTKDFTVFFLPAEVNDSSAHGHHH